MTNHDFIKNDKSSQKSISHLSPQQMNSVIAMGLFLAWKNKMETVEDPEPLPENLQKLHEEYHSADFRAFYAGMIMLSRHIKKQPERLLPDIDTGITMPLFLAWKNNTETIEAPEPLPENLQELNEEYLSADFRAFYAGMIMFSKFKNQ